MTLFSLSIFSGTRLSSEAWLNFARISSVLMALSGKRTFSPKRWRNPPDSASLCRSLRKTSARTERYVRLQARELQQLFLLLPVTKPKSMAFRCSHTQTVGNPFFVLTMFTIVAVEVVVVHFFELNLWAFMTFLSHDLRCVIHEDSTRSGDLDKIQVGKVELHELFPFAVGRIFGHGWKLHGFQSRKRWNIK